MGRKFDEKEKEMLRSRLLEAGKELFGTFGLKKTSIAELTKAVGIAQGTFYQFFQSKEELYFAIMEMEEERIRQSLLQGEFLSQPLSKERFKRFLKHAIVLIETNPFFRELYQGEVVEYLLRKLPAEQIERNLDKDADYFLPLIQHWQEKKVMVNLDPMLIMSVIRSLILLTLQKKAIGEEFYSATIDLYIDFIADGLIREESTSHD
jgi:AcrR family transcriptional regulator